MMDFPPHIAERMRQGDIELCQIQFINIELVRQQSGDRWQHLKRKVFDIGAFFIEKRLHADDVVLRCKDGFIVIFADAKPPPPARRAESLSIEMNEFFVGDEAFRALAVKCHHLKLRPRELFAWLSKQDATLDETVRQPRSAPGDTDTLPAPGKTAPKPAPERPDPIETAEVMFEPVWDRKLEVVTTNMVLAQGTHPHTGHALRGRQLCAGEDRRRQNARYDCRLLDRTIEEVEAMHAAHRPAAFSIPVHLQTIHRRESRMEYFSRLRCLAEPLRRHLFFCIEGLSAGTPISQIEDTFRSLRPFGTGAMASLAFGTIDFRPFNTVEMRLVGWSSPAHEPNAGLSTVQLDQVKRLVSVAKDKKMRTFMAQVSDQNVLKQCVELGIDFITGPIVGESQSHASPPYALPREDLMGKAYDVFEI